MNSIKNSYGIDKAKLTQLLFKTEGEMYWKELEDKNFNLVIEKEQHVNKYKVYLTTLEATQVPDYIVEKYVALKNGLIKFGALIK
jgi:hypothetical protein